MKTRPFYKEHALFLAELEDLNIPPNCEKLGFAKKINNSIGYEVIRWNNRKHFWFTSAFFTYYLRRNYNIEMGINDDVNWMAKVKNKMEAKDETNAST